LYDILSAFLSKGGWSSAHDSVNRWRWKKSIKSIHGRSYQDANRDWRKNRRKKLAPKSAQGSQNTPAPILAYFLR
jgi:hypothetical protein